MKRLILLLLLLSVFVPGLFSQVNQKYIRNEARKQASWTKQAVFIKGYVIDNQKDTIDTNILIFTKKYKLNSYLFCVTKNSNDSIIIIPASDLLGYGYDKTHYRKAKEKDEHFFIKQIQTGTVSLFERVSIPSDMRYMYYLQKKNQQGYFEICPDESNFIEISKRSNNGNNNTSSGNDILIMTNNNVGRFKVFVQNYFGDCISVRNKVNAEVYNITDLPAIVAEYNNYKEGK